jgi:hypothetical protein
MEDDAAMIGPQERAQPSPRHQQQQQQQQQPVAPAAPASRQPQSQLRLTSPQLSAPSPQLSVEAEYELVNIVRCGVLPVYHGVSLFVYCTPHPSSSCMVDAMHSPHTT